MKIAFYGRVSSEEQAERGNIETQVEFAKKYFDLHGPQLEIEKYEMYLDEGISGTIPLAERPAGARLLQDARAKKFDAVYVYRLDRLARSTKCVLEAYEYLDGLGISLKSMTETFDTSTSTGKFFMTLLASVAALERDTILERTQLGKEQKARLGKWISGPPPFGYRIGDDGKLDVEESEAETVRLIYSLYLQGMTTVPIAEYLNARNIPTPAKSKRTRNNATHKWNAGHISIILNNRAYTGEYVWMKRTKKKREKISVEIPVIIDESIFARAQELLAQNADVARGKRGRQYLLRGLIRCGNCGRAMVGSSGESKGGRVYYRCTGAINQGSGKQCEAKMIRARDIEDAIWQDITEFLRNPGGIAELIEKQMITAKEEVLPIDRELEAVKQAIMEKQAARNKIIAMCTRNLITDKEAERELTDLGKEMQSLESRLNFLFEQKETTSRVETEAINAKVLLERLQGRLEELSDEEKAELIRGLVKQITVYTDVKDGQKTSRAVVHYRFWQTAEGKPLYGSSNSAYSQTHTMISIETAWVFQAFSRRGGERISMQ